MSEKLVEELAKAFDVSQGVMRHLLVTAHRRYKTYQVAKRSGRGTRTIAQPAREIKFLQRWAVNHYIEPLPVHSAAKAYETRSSIRENAGVHKNNNFLLKMDFKDFFPSIKMGDFTNFARDIKTINLDENSLVLLGLLFFWRPKGRHDLVMSIGAPSSPRLSNRMMYGIDERIDRICNENGVLYTRYADDLSFSTDQPHVLSETKREVENILSMTSSPDLQINDAKTVWTSRKHLRMITGVTLTNDRDLSIGRDRKRQIRAALHRFSLGQLSNPEALKLKGELAFAFDVEPDFVVRMEAKYGQQVIRAVQRYETTDMTEK